jgi:hypothetical protein
MGRGRKTSRPRREACSEFGAVAEAKTAKQRTHRCRAAGDSPQGKFQQRPEGGAVGLVEELWRGDGDVTDVGDSDYKGNSGTDRVSWL